MSESSSSLSPPPLLISTFDTAATGFSGEYLLSREYASTVRELMPLEYRFSQFRLLFSPKIHGISIPSFYRHVDQCPYPSVMILKDSRPACCVLGAFCKAPWINNRKFFGSSENFVFQILKCGKSNVHVFPCVSSTARLYQFCDDKRIVVGQGAICVYDNWLRASSGPCETYGTSGPLTCKKDFVIGDIELWAIIPDNASCDPGKPIS
jgi:hypothetical protein